MTDSLDLLDSEYVSNTILEGTVEYVMLSVSLGTVMSRGEEYSLRFLFLDNKNTVVVDEHNDTVNHMPLYPREMVERALALGAIGVIIIRKHAPVDPTPSKVDIEMTREAKKAFDAVGITLYDFMICGRGEDGFEGLKSLKKLGIF